MIYGGLYGASAVAVYGLLDAIGQPTFYDKLLAVPLLNLSARALDRVATTTSLSRLDPGRLLGGLAGRRRNLAWLAVWAVVFISIDAAEGVGDTHPGNRLPFWRQACEEQRRNACRNLLIMESNFCARGSGWACNELGILAVEGRVKGMERFRGEELPARLRAGVLRRLRQRAEPGAPVQRVRHGLPSPDDYYLMLESKSPPRQMSNYDLWEAACKQAGARAA